MSGARSWSSSSTGGLAGTWRQWWTTCQRLQWRSRVISRSTCCAKNEPAPCNVHFGGKLGIFAPGGLAAAGSLTIVYPLDYARTRLASDVGSGKKTFDGLLDCLKKTASGPKGFFSFHAGLGVSLGGIIPYRGFQLGALDTIVGLNPWKNDTRHDGLLLHLCGGTDSHYCRRWYQLSLRHRPWAPPDAGRAAS